MQKARKTFSYFLQTSLKSNHFCRHLQNNYYKKSKMLNKIFTTLCLLFLCAINASPQVFKYIGMEDGLSSRRVLSIQQGAQDYMWILTHKGVDRFDGKHFKHYILQKNDKAVNFYPNLNQITVDKDNILWEYGKDGLVFYYDEMKDSFQLAFDARESYNEIKHSPITATYFDSQNNIWFSCNKKLILFNTIQNNSINIDNNIGENITGITEVNNSRYYFTTGKRIYNVDIKNQKIEDIKTIDFEYISVINYIYYHNETNLLLISTLLNGLFIYNPSTEEIYDLGNHLNDVSINTIKPYNKNPYEVLIATDGDGVYKLNLKTNKFIHFLKEDYVNPNKMNGSIIKDLCIDKSDRIWNVIYPTGITIYSEKYKSFEWVKHSNNNKNSLVDDRINGIIEDSDGDIWFATTNGISCYNIKNRSWKNYFSEHKKDKYSNNHIFISLCEYKPGVILAGGYMSGIYEINKNTGEIDYFTHSINKGKTPDKYIRSILKDSDGTIWRGGFYTLRSYNDVTKKSMTYSTTYPITCIKEKDQNTLWIGTINGLFILDKNKDKMEEYELSYQCGCINAIYQTEKGDAILFHHRTGGIGSFHIFFKSGITSGVLTFQQAELTVNQRGGTDGGQRTTGRTEAQNDLAQPFVSCQIGRSGQSARQYQHLGIPADSLGIELHIGLNRYSVRTGHTVLSCH